MNEKYKSTLEKYKNILKNELGYADTTMQTYCSHLKEYFSYFDKPALHLTKSDYKWFIQNHKFNYSKHNQFISSVKLFYEHMLNYKIKDNIFIRPRKERRLPDILTKQEVENILSSIDNLKQKTIKKNNKHMELKEAIDLLNFRDKIFYSENELTENYEIAELYLKSIDSAQGENSIVINNDKPTNVCEFGFSSSRNCMAKCGYTGCPYEL